MTRKQFFFYIYFSFTSGFILAGPLKLILDTPIYTINSIDSIDLFLITSVEKYDDLYRISITDKTYNYNSSFKCHESPSSIHKIYLEITTEHAMTILGNVHTLSQPSNRSCFALIEQQKLSTINEQKSILKRSI